MNFLFVGESDYNFDNGHYYKLINIVLDNKVDLYYAILINKHNMVVVIPYKNIDSFNINWIYKNI